MGKRSWFSAVKKAISPSYSKVKKAKRSQKSKSNPNMSLVTCPTQTEATLANHPPYHYPHIEEKEPENEQIKHVDTVTYTVQEEEDTASQATSEAVNSVTYTVQEEEDTASQATAEAVNCITDPHFLGKSIQELAAIKIQTAYRGYLARRDYQPLRVRRRLRVLIRSQAVKRQTASAITTMQTMARVQSQVRSRNIRMVEVNEALERQLRQRREKELHKPAFDLSPKSREQVEASLRNKKEAAERREKALTYAYSRQMAWRNSSKAAKFTDPDYLDWSWSWSERWNVVKPWETETTSNSETVGAMGKHVSHQSPSKSISKVLSSVSGERLKSATSKGSTKSMNAGPSPLRSSNTGNLVGSTKKRNVPSGNKKSLTAPRKTSKTVR